MNDPAKTSALEPQTLNQAGIAARIPHAGRMGLLDSLLSWSDQSICCRISNHADADHPLRSEGGLWATAAIEYASQAMALHSALRQSGDAAARAGFLASARGVSLKVARLDTVGGPLQVQAQRLMGDARQALYQFTLHDQHGALLVQGRTTVVLDGIPTGSPA